MANIKSAKKRIKVIDRKTARNRRVKDHLKTVLKSFDSAIEAGDFEQAAEKLKLAEKKLMRPLLKVRSKSRLLQEKFPDWQKDSTLPKQRNKSHPSPPVYKLNTHARAAKTMDVSPIVFSLS